MLFIRRGGEVCGWVSGTSDRASQNIFGLAHLAGLTIHEPCYLLVYDLYYYSWIQDGQDTERYDTTASSTL